jgi:hypothetical protein
MHRYLWKFWVRVPVNLRTLLAPNVRWLMAEGRALFDVMKKH